MSDPQDPRDPEEPRTFTRDTGGDGLPAETPEADAAEQRTALRRDEDESSGEEPAGPGGSDTEADDADRAEQARPAGGDEDDDYR
ncbi:hypothetical protein [Streptomyces sp. 8L]|uniref:hypothetical protein n=1 Tax=Streptomyces sp. 8L TaxID=2877242 RepID=UPI001CD6DCE7|nr:hypothetical protein [Streptomyces sp. 8L]MCA1222308.1 hypothetical protein [Streptomyces sp. 8L]